MRCPVCKSKNSDDAIFCQACRTPLSQAQQAQQAQQVQQTQQTQPAGQPVQTVSQPPWNIPQQAEAMQYNQVQVQGQSVNAQQPLPYIASGQAMEQPLRYTQTPDTPHAAAHQPVQYTQEQVQAQPQQQRFTPSDKNAPLWQVPVHQQAIPLSAVPSQNANYGQYDKNIQIKSSRKSTGNMFYNEETVGGFLTRASKILIIITRIVFILQAALCVGILVAFLTSYSEYSAAMPNSVAIIAAMIIGIVIFGLLAFFTPLFYSVFYGLGVLIDDIKEIRDAAKEKGDNETRAV